MPTATRLVLVTSALLALGAADPPAVVLEVHAGAHTRRANPIVFPLPEPLLLARGFRLEVLEDKRAVDLQRFNSFGLPKLAFLLEAPLDAGSSRRYRLVGEPARPAQNQAVCRDDGKALTLEVDGRVVLRYNTAVIDPPAGIDPVYKRSGFIHPLLSPAGHVLTDDFAPDHPHQHGLFLAWVNTTSRGHLVDFWNQKASTGRIRHLQNHQTASGPVLAGFEVALRHEDITAPERPIPVLNEEWTVRAYRSNTAHLVDFESNQRSEGDHPLKIAAHHFGGLCLRGNRAWYDPQAGNGPPNPARSGRSEFLTSEDKHRIDGDQTRPRWIDLSGQVDGQVAGITILGNPENFRAPQLVRIHPNKPYFCFAPMALGEFRIELGHSYLSRYRLMLHDGPPNKEAIEAAWRDYAEPPVVRVVNDSPME